MSECPICGETEGVIDDYCHACSQDLGEPPLIIESSGWNEDKGFDKNEVWPSSMKATLENTEFQDEVLEEDGRGKLSPEVCKAIKEGAYVSQRIGGAILDSRRVLEMEI